MRQRSEKRRRRRVGKQTAGSIRSAQRRRGRFASRERSVCGHLSCIGLAIRSYITHSPAVDDSFTEKTNEPRWLESRLRLQEILANDDLSCFAMVNGTPEVMSARPTGADKNTWNNATASVPRAEPRFPVYPSLRYHIESMGIDVFSRIQCLRLD